MLLRTIEASFAKLNHIVEQTCDDANLRTIATTHLDELPIFGTLTKEQLENRKMAKEFRKKELKNKAKNLLAGSSGHGSRGHNPNYKGKNFDPFFHLKKKAGKGGFKGKGIAKNKNMPAR
jgi:hypothetical protein